MEQKSYLKEILLKGKNALLSRYCKRVCTAPKAYLYGLNTRIVRYRQFFLWVLGKK